MDQHIEDEHLDGHRRGHAQFCVRVDRVDERRGDAMRALREREPKRREPTRALLDELEEVRRFGRLRLPDPNLLRKRVLGGERWNHRGDLVRPQVGADLRPRDARPVRADAEVDRERRAGPRPIGRNLAPCRFVVEADGDVVDGRSGLPMTGPFLRKIILGLCSDSDGYLIGRDDAVRARAVADVARFLNGVFAGS